MPLVISKICNAATTEEGHSWCMNRNFEECHCECECHKRRNEEAYARTHRECIEKHAVLAARVAELERKYEPDPDAPQEFWPAALHACCDDEKTWNDAGVDPVRANKIKAVMRRAAHAYAELERERHEVHAMLTGKGEVAWCMSHPGGEPDTELGKAAAAANVERDKLRARVAELERQ